MRRVRQILAGLSLALVGLLFVPMAKADAIYDFSIILTYGPATGTLTGRIDLPFVSADGTGSGAASSLFFTSVPAGFLPLISVYRPFGQGNVVTNWADQVTNYFSVSNGVITSFQFFAVTSGSTEGDVFGINSTANTAGSFGGWFLPAGLNGLSTTDAYAGYNFNGLSGVTFTPSSVSVVPEPSTISLMLVGLGLLGLMTAARRTALT